MSEEKTMRAIALPSRWALAAIAALLLAFGLMAWSAQPAFADGDDQQPPVATEGGDEAPVPDAGAGDAGDPVDDEGSEPATEGDDVIEPEGGDVQGEAGGQGEAEPVADDPIADAVEGEADAPEAVPASDEDDVTENPVLQESQAAPEDAAPEVAVCIKFDDAATAAEKAEPAATSDKATAATAAKTMTAASTPMAAAASKTYTVRFYDAYGNLVKKQKVKAGKNATAPKLAAMANRTFKGWSTSIKKVRSNLFVYPIFKDKKSNYFFIIDATDDSSSSYKSVNSRTYKAGTMVYLSEPSMNSSTKRKLVIGYSTLPNGKGDVYGMGDSFSMPAHDLIVYPIYAKQSKVKTFTLRRGRNGGTNTSYAVAGATYRLTSYGPTSAGYRLVGFSTKANGKGKVYALGSTFTMPSKNTTLYGVWKKSTARLRLMGNFTKATNATYYVPAGVDLPLPSDSYYFNYNVSRDGYYLKGFNTKANGKGTSYTFGTGSLNGEYGPTYVTVPKSGLTLYAQWGKLKKVTLKANFKGGSDAEQQVTAGSITYLNGGIYREGYSLVGFTTKKNGSGTLYKTGGYFKAPNKNMTLYAQWKKNSAKVTYNANGGSFYGESATSTSAVAQGLAFTVSAYPSRANYILAGWNTKKDGSGAMYLNYAPVAAAKSQTLYAQWKKAATLTLDPNYTGSSGVTTRTVLPGTYTTISGYSAPSRSGFGFLGWSTSKNGSVKYASGSEVKVPAKGLKLYAKWKANNATITLNANGGKVYDSASGKDASSTKVSVAKGATLNTYKYPTRDGDYSFIGWNTKKSGKGTAYSASDLSSSYSALDAFKVSKSMTLYAQWQKSPKLTYVANNGTKAKDVDVYSGIMLSDDKGFTKKNKALAGWNTKANGKGAAFAMGEYVECLPAAGLTLYAQWQSPTATITFNGNGKVANQTQKVMKGKYNYVRVPSEPVAKDGKSYFKEWNTKKNGKGETISNGLRYQSGKASTFYAIWGTKETVKFDANGGTGSTTQYVGPSDWTYFGSVSSGVSREGYELIGWSSNKAATTADYTEYESAALYEKDGATRTLYAIWGEKEVVSFSANGGAGTPASIVLGQYGWSYLSDASAAVSRSGYELLGWSENASATAADYGPNEEISFTGYGVKRTLYAIWQEDV